MARALGAVALGSSNPVTRRRDVGGVARNVAETLARLGAAVSLVSRVGTDAEAEPVLEPLRRVGIGVDWISRSLDTETANYTAFIDRDGELIVGMIADAIYDEMTPAVIGPAAQALADRDFWLIDANLPRASVAHLLSHPARPPVAVDLVSVAKAERLAGLIGQVDIVRGNRDEIALLSGAAIDTPADAVSAATRLCAAGAGAVVVGLGAEGLCIADRGGARHLPRHAAGAAVGDAPVRNVTGAGDALTAGLVFGRALGLPLADSARLGLVAAMITAGQDGSVAPGMDAATLLARAGVVLPQPVSPAPVSPVRSAAPLPVEPTR